MEDLTHVGWELGHKKQGSWTRIVPKGVQTNEAEALEEARSWVRQFPDQYELRQLLARPDEGRHG